MSEKTPQQIVEEWNAMHPVGTRVRVGRSSKQGGAFLTETKCAAYVLTGWKADNSDGTPVVEVNGMQGWVALSVVLPVDSTLGLGERPAESSDPLPGFLHCPDTTT